MRPMASTDKWICVHDRQQSRSVESYLDEGTERVIYTYALVLRIGMNTKTILQVAVSCLDIWQILHHCLLLISTPLHHCIIQIFRSLIPISCRGYHGSFIWGHYPLLTDGRIIMKCRRSANVAVNTAESIDFRDLPATPFDSTPKWV